MQEQIITLIPAIRMMLSEEEVKTLRFSAEGETTVNLQSEAAFKSSIGQQNGIFTELSETVLSEISVKMIESKTPVHVIGVKGFGCLTVSGKGIGSGRVEHKIAIVTGGAQGFGAGIVEHLMQNGANVVIADLNAKKGQEFADSLNAAGHSNQALFVQTNVADAASVQNLIAETVKAFGGLDLFISNAGILRAGGLDEMTPETFELMTKVNYSAYFLCAKYASKVMKIQHQWKNDHFTDIIQINSKSGLKGSNKNFAYAGGKFGGIGLTQSFAMELMPFKIKVNSVCPGNFFDGPLWADPETGLFVQYLRAGKVPGAKTIEDVKRFYEAQVPAGRGCTPLDVMRAVYYIIEQEYETGQAVPVTGGQNMLN